MNGKPTRRSFFGKAGAALAAPFVATVALGGELHGKTYVVGRRELLEDVNAIRVLLHDYARRVSAGSQAGPMAGVRRLILDGDSAIEVRANGTATARVPCTVETATPIDGDETVVEMARLQGDGVIRRTERRVLESTYVRRVGVWKIDRVTYSPA
jgi:hypothetical protein